MTDVTIEHCVSRGFREQALTVQTALLERFGGNLGSVAPEPGHGGVFRVAVDGESVWDREAHGTNPDVAAIGDAAASSMNATDGSPADVAPAEGNP